MSAEGVMARIDALTENAKAKSEDADENNRAKSDAYLELSEYLCSYGCYKSAAYYFEMAFKLRRDYIHDPLNARICIMAGICQMRIGSLIQAERFFGYALAAAKQSEAADYVCISTINMALVYLAQGHTAEALKWGDNALDEADQHYEKNSQEYLDIVRAMLSIHINMGSYETAIKMIDDTEFSVIESCLLKAGCYQADEEYDKAKSVLLEAHGQYHSDMRIKEARTPTLTRAASMGKSTNNMLEALIESDNEDDQESAMRFSPIKGSPQRDRVPSNLWFDGNGENPNNAMTVEAHERKTFGSDTFSNWDFGKQKEYSCRDQVMPALVDYNLSVVFGMRGDFDRQKEYLSEAVDIMYHIVKRLEKDTAGVIVQQATAGLTKETVLPSVDTLLSVYVAQWHFQASLSEELFLHGPLSTSLKVQDSQTIEPDPAKSDERQFLLFVLEELNTSISSWKKDHQLENMMLVYKENKIVKEKRLEEEKASEKATGGEMIKLKSMKSKLKNMSRRAKSMGEEVQGSTEKPTSAAERVKAEALEEDNKRKAEAEAKIQDEIMDCTNSDLHLANTSVSNILHASNFGVREEEQISLDGFVVSDTYSEVAAAAARANAQLAKSTVEGSKSKKKATKSDSAISTRGSIKQEMMPTSRPNHVEGITDADAEIAEVMELCQGLGYGAFGMSGEAEWEENEARTNRRSEPGSKALKSYLETLIDAKRRLQVVEGILVPKKSAEPSSRQEAMKKMNAKEKGNEGTLLALYTTLTSLSASLGQKKDCGQYINRLNNLAERIQHPQYQAIATRMGIDFEEWVQSSSSSYTTAKSNARLKKLHNVLLNTKRYLGYAKKCRDVDIELYFDAHKRLINCYCDISSLPVDGSVEVTDDYADHIEKNKTLSANLKLLSPQDIADSESTDIEWLYQYSGVRARQCQEEMMEEMKEVLESSHNTLQGVGVIPPDKASVLLSDLPML